MTHWNHLQSLGKYNAARNKYANLPADGSGQKVDNQLSALINL